MSNVTTSAPTVHTYIFVTQNTLTVRSVYANELTCWRKPYHMRNNLMRYCLYAVVVVILCRNVENDQTPTQWSPLRIAAIPGKGK